MPMLIKKKKAQSIIEVMIAMTIVTVVLGSTMALILNAVNLVMIAQSRTEAIEIAQKGIAEGVLIIQKQCGVDIAGANLDHLYTTVDSTNSTHKTLTVSATNPPTGLDPNAFQTLVATVDWTDRGSSAQTVTIQQVVRIHE